MPHYTLPPTGDQFMWDIWMSCYILPTVTVADELGVFSALAAQPTTAAKLAARFGFDERAVSAILLSLASNGLLQRRGDRYRLSGATGYYLLPDSPGYWGPILLAHRGNHLHLWLKSKLTAEGPTVPRNSIGAIGDDIPPADAWSAGKINPELARSVAAYMHAHSLSAAIAAARAIDLSDVTRLLDVGGGSGVFSIAFAQRYPAILCTVLDLEPVCDAAKAYIEAGDVADRVETVSIDMFRAPWPIDHDAVIFSNVLHDWDAATALRLACRAYEALPSGGRVLVHEMLLAENAPGPLTTANFSMHMLLTDGRQYTFEDVRELLECAGFSDVERVDTHGYYTVVTGYRP